MMLMQKQRRYFLFFLICTMYNCDTRSIDHRNAFFLGSNVEFKSHEQVQSTQVRNRLDALCLQHGVTITQNAFVTPDPFGLHARSVQLRRAEVADYPQRLATFANDVKNLPPEHSIPEFRDRVQQALAEDPLPVQKDTTRAINCKGANRKYSVMCIEKRKRAHGGSAFFSNE